MSIPGSALGMKIGRNVRQSHNDWLALSSPVRRKNASIETFGCRLGKDAGQPGSHLEAVIWLSPYVVAYVFGLYWRSRRLYIEQVTWD